MTFKRQRNKTDKEQADAKKHAEQERHKSMKGDMSNKKFAEENGSFKEACKKAEVEPTTRQASKFRNKTGAAYNATR